ncbi:MAG TPA: DUF3179 domain-containing protein [Longimicrobiales bacterium]|nr:DUF3179 domain-containing protein [Longimicrobiales bacterium]
MTMPRRPPAFVIPALLPVALLAAGSLTAQEWKTDFSRHVVPLEEIVPGGPPRDGIPAIDRPRFVDVRFADSWIEDTEPVMVIDVGGEVRIYPIQILIWHEIVNDRIGDLPIAVTFCPLCNTALAFDRRLAGDVLDFGTTGRLRHSDMVMYDRQTESWWQQATGEGIVGQYAGESLEFVPARMFDWGQTKQLYPAARVLSRETGHERPYGRNPYAGYDRGDAPMPGFFEGPADSRLHAMERVVAVRIGDAAVAYPFTSLRRARVANDTVAGDPVVVLWVPGAASALDASTVAGGREVGSTAVFERRIGGRILTLEPADIDGRFRDLETGSTWALDGRAVAGPLNGEQLRSIVHGDFFWFAWSVFRPETRVWQ